MTNQLLSTAPDDAIGTVKLSLLCGRLVYKQIRQEIKSFCATRLMDCSIETDMGWIDGYIYATVRGRAADIRALQRYIDSLE